MALTFITWLWGTKYDATDITKLAHSVRRHYRAHFRFVVFTDRALDLPPLIEVKPIADPALIGRGCFCRLRMFDPQWQFENQFYDHIACLDLDAVITGDIRPVFDRLESFLILQGVNAANPCPFNASVMMLRAGHHADVWRDFSLANANAIRFHKFPDDQAWIWHKLPDASGWKGGTESGIYAYQKPGWPPGTKLPTDARMVVFFGWRKPKMFAHLRWVQEHWKTD